MLKQLDDLKDSGVKNIQPLWIVNMISLEATPEAIRRISSMDDVGSIELTQPVELIRPIGGERSSPMPGHAEQSLRIINADKMWALGFTGQGVTVANMDTGVDGDHPALADNWKGNTVPWNQAWFDYEFNTTFPIDTLWDWSTGHGSHTMGRCVAWIQKLRIPSE